jgi:hypothetical protein
MDNNHHLSNESHNVNENSINDLIRLHEYTNIYETISMKDNIIDYKMKDQESSWISEVMAEAEKFLERKRSEMELEKLHFWISAGMMIESQSNKENKENIIKVVAQKMALIIEIEKEIESIRKITKLEKDLKDECTRANIFKGQVKQLQLEMNQVKQDYGCYICNELGHKKEDHFK